MWRSLNIPRRLGMALWVQKAGFQVAGFIGFKDFKTLQHHLFKQNERNTKMLRFGLKKSAIKISIAETYSFSHLLKTANTSCHNANSLCPEMALHHKYHQRTSK